MQPAIPTISPTVQAALKFLALMLGVGIVEVVVP